MHETTVLADGHAFLVLADSFPYRADLTSNGLVALEADHAVVYTGVWGGDVSVTGVLLDAAPVQTSGWEVVVEFSAVVSDSRPLQVASRAELDEIDPVATEPGGYAIRLSARGRDAQFDLVADGTEEYLLQAWPAPETPLRVVNIEDQVGRGMYRPVTGRADRN